VFVKTRFHLASFEACVNSIKGKEKNGKRYLPQNSNSEFNHNEPPVRPHGQTRTFRATLIYMLSVLVRILRGGFEFGITAAPPFP
jgi:hypothetical protein